jgi:adenine deaminase
MESFFITGNIVDIPARQVFFGKVEVAGKKIKNITAEGAAAPGQPFILPGFIDSHVHIESSMLVPSEFAKLAVVHGTVGTISDPHEIANVCGMEGVQFMIDNGMTVPFKFNFGAPSCVPATAFETAGAALNAVAVDELLAKPEIKYLSEMMNFPGVLNKDEEVLKKIASAKKYGKPVDGHAPGLRGEAAKQYIDAGITTDHECFTAAEALDKLQYGMKILIREGSAAKNFEALADLLHEHYGNMMLCSDDKHPDSLADGHINVLCARAVAKGIDIFKVLQAACINPVLHYKMDVGLLKKDDPADFIVVKDLQKFGVLQTYIEGALVAEQGRSFIKAPPPPVINVFDCDALEEKDIYLRKPGKRQIEVIETLDGQLITDKYLQDVDDLLRPDGSGLTGNTDIDVLKIVVVNRYVKSKPAVAFIKNTGLKEGALASSVAHDSHNIVAVGVDDAAICRAVNLVIAQRGGISAVSKNAEKVLALPVGGLMSDRDGYEVAAAYTAIDQFVKESLGSTLSAPFMTLSFMALLVIPHIKLSDKGLFDGDRFSFIAGD